MMGKLPLPRRVVRQMVLAGLRLHNFSYRMVGSLSQRLEADGLHPKHRIMRYHRFFVDHVSAAETVLDIGCGNGALTLDLAAKCKRVWGVDMNDRNVAEARRRIAAAGLGNVEFLVGDATRMEFPFRADCAVLSNVLEHMDGRVEALSRLARVAGRLLIRVPLIEREWLAVYKREMGVEHRLDPTHFVEYTQEEFHREIAEAGLALRRAEIRFGEIWADCQSPLPAGRVG